MFLNSLLLKRNKERDRELLEGELSLLMMPFILILLKSMSPKGRIFPDHLLSKSSALTDLIDGLNNRRGILLLLLSKPLLILRLLRLRGPPFWVLLSKGLSWLRLPPSALLPENCLLMSIEKSPLIILRCMIVPMTHILPIAILGSTLTMLALTRLCKFKDPNVLEA